MEITPEELEALKKSVHAPILLVDMRTEEERAYGTIPGSVQMSGEALLASPPEDKNTKIVVFCARGVLSLDVADALSGMGYDAASLSGGYAEWLRGKIEREHAAEVTGRVEGNLRKRYKTDLLSKFLKAIKTYDLIQNGDRIAVCISGGKDSMLMAKLFQEVHRHGKYNFGVEYVVMDPGYNETNRAIIEQNAKNLGIPIRIFETNIFDSVYNVEKSPCYLCARMRRGHLYSYAKSLGCNKIALGHHYDDVIETILMGMLYGSQIQSMMPKLHSTSYPGMELIRPLYLVHEEDILAWKNYNGLTFLQCACRFTEEAERAGREHLSKRKETKELLRSLRRTNPDVEKHIFRSIHLVNVDTLLGYELDGVEHSFLEEYARRGGEKGEKSQEK